MKFYPSWRYHISMPPMVVYNEAEDLALGEEWQDSPAKFSSITEEVSTTDGQGHGGPAEPSENYREHMAKWKSKEEKQVDKPKSKRGKH